MQIQDKGSLVKVYQLKESESVSLVLMQASFKLDYRARVDP